MSRCQAENLIPSAVSVTASSRATRAKVSGAVTTVSTHKIAAIRAVARGAIYSIGAIRIAAPSAALAAVPTRWKMTASMAAASSTPRTTRPR